jgi:signal transduction histidine kinase
MERQAAQEALQDLNVKLEEEAKKRQTAQEALQDLNIKLEEEAKKRQAAQEALQDLNIKLEEEAKKRQAAQEALQDLNIKLEEEAKKREAAQEVLQDLNFDLEDTVAERTRELQDINAILKEEVMERQDAQEALAKSNNSLESQVIKRTQELQDINATLEEEIMERQAAQEALQESRDALLVREQQLKYYGDEVAATNTELKVFVNTIAHDFRSPMVNLKGFSTELGYSLAELKEIVCDSALCLPQEVHNKVNELLDKDVPDAQQFINSAVDRLSRMVDALLNLSRLGRREMHYEEVDMNKLVSTIMQSYKHQITERQIQVEVGTLPKIQIDHLVMEQIISNLIDNAIKYMDPNRQGKIVASCTENGQEYVVSVQDNGRGIQETDREKIFDVFRRLGNQDQPGEGMGLAYVRTLIRKLGGKVWCESELGVGTKMSFKLPKNPPAY